MPPASTSPSPVPHELTAADYEALAQFRHGLRRFLSFTETGARLAGLTPQQHQALLAIKAHGSARPISIGALADQLLIKNHSAVELVARLVKAGLIARGAAVEDRRRVLLTLTERGDGVLSALSQSNLRELRMIAPSFSGILRQLNKAAKA